MQWKVYVVKFVLKKTIFIKKKSKSLKVFVVDTSAANSVSISSVTSESAGAALCVTANCFIVTSVWSSRAAWIGS